MNRPDRILARVRFFAALALAAGALAAAGPAAAQPFGSWNSYQRGDNAYIRIPHSAALNPTGALTIEGWVNITDPSGCSNIIGKNWEQTYWIGLCGTTLRSYLRGTTSQRNGGTLPPGQWTHFAVTFDGATRRHYINGELAVEFADPGALPTNGAEVRIGSDVEYENFRPNGSINEIRFWNVARTLAQIRSTINVAITTAQPGLVAVWAGGGPNDVVGSHDGTRVGTLETLTFPVTGAGCTSTDTLLCLHDRFVLTGSWRTGSGSGTAHVADFTTPQSGIFWFFNETNWEVTVKVLDGCGLNNRWWYFSSAGTNVFYRIEVFDQEEGFNKIYFNYPGPPAPAVTDTNALATCP